MKDAITLNGKPIPDTYDVTKCTSEAEEFLKGMRADVEASILADHSDIHSHNMAVIAARGSK
jgi:hypothetical protein